MKMPVLSKKFTTLLLSTLALAGVVTGCKQDKIIAPKAKTTPVILDIANKPISFQDTMTFSVNTFDIENFSVDAKTPGVLIATNHEDIPKIDTNGIIENHNIVNNGEFWAEVTTDETNGLRTEIRPTAASATTDTCYGYVQAYVWGDYSSKQAKYPAPNKFTDAKEPDRYLPLSVNVSRGKGGPLGMSISKDEIVEFKVARFIVNGGAMFEKAFQPGDVNTYQTLQPYSEFILPSADIIFDQNGRRNYIPRNALPVSVSM
jgi:hypothetical protein